MSENNDDGVKEVVEKSKESITITIELKPGGDMQVSGPLDQPVTMLGILELAKEMVHKIGRGEQKVKRQSNIVIPMIGPKRPM